MINVVIIEDEILIRKNLSLMLKEYCPEINVVAMLNSGAMALEILPVLEFDLVFADIQLGDMDAFTLFSKIDHFDKYIIFVTAFDDFALDSFKFNTIDYLIKPVQPSELIRAVNKAYERLLVLDRFSSLQGTHASSKSGKILVKSNDEIHFLTPELIVYCEADGAYTIVHIDEPENEKKLITTHLKKIEEVLPKGQFFRIHDAHIINCNYIDHIKYQKRICVLRNQSTAEKIELKISERKYPIFIEFLKNN